MKDKRLAKRKSDTHLDRIYKFYFEEKSRVELSPHEITLKTRWSNIWKLITGKILSERNAVKMQMKEYGVSEKTAYADLSNAKSLFGDPKEGEKEIKIAIATEWIVKLLRKAEKAADFKAAEKLILRYTKLHRLDEDNNPLMELLKKQRPAQIIFNADPATLEKQAAELMADIEDVDYEDMSDED